MSHFLHSMCATKVDLSVKHIDVHQMPKHSDKPLFFLFFFIFIFLHRYMEFFFPVTSNQNVHTRIYFCIMDYFLIYCPIRLKANKIRAPGIERNFS